MFILIKIHSVQCQKAKYANHNPATFKGDTLSTPIMLNAKISRSIIQNKLKTPLIVSIALINKNLKSNLGNNNCSRRGITGNTKEKHKVNITGLRSIMEFNISANPSTEREREEVEVISHKLLI